MANLEQFELDQMAENEVDRLQKQLRKMEKDCETFHDEKRNALMKREKIAETLQRERTQLEERLLSIHHGSHARKEIQVSQTRTHSRENCFLFCLTRVFRSLYSTKAKKELRRLMERREIISKSMNEQKTRMWELDGHVKKV